MPCHSGTDFRQLAPIHVLGAHTGRIVGTQMVHGCRLGVFWDDQRCFLANDQAEVALHFHATLTSFDLLSRWGHTTPKLLS